MFLNTRRFSVWLVSFLVVLVVYFIYNRISRTPAINSSGSNENVYMISDACDSNSRTGKVGDVGVGAVKNVRYTKLNAQRQVEGEFGFEELLHQDGNEWEIEKPYYTMYRRGFKCTISGDRARVTVETSGGRVTPKQGLLTGNVMIRIWPKSKDGIGEAVVYLDDIFFMGEKSLFSTTGMVELISQNIRLEGTGMELIYDGDAERLDLLKIKQLQNLHIKRWSRGTVFGSTLSTSLPAGAGRDGEKAGEIGSEYKCVLEKNVVIETFRERLLADIVSINNIFVEERSEEENGVEKTPVGRQSTLTRSAGSSNSGTPAVKEAGEVSIKCDGAVTIIPIDSALGKNLKTVEPGCEEIASQREGGKATLCAGRFDYNAATGEAIALGPSQVVFDANGANGNRPATVAITSQKKARFEPAANKVSFEGDCRCTVSQAVRLGSPQADGNATHRYFVLADKLEVDLAQKGNVKNGTSMDVERLVAKGPDVLLASTKKAVRPGSPQAGEQMLMGIELKCAGIDYNTVSRNFIATGPGLIKVDNSQTDEPQEKLGRLSLRRKCYAFLRNFDSLEFNGGTNHLVADSNGGSLLVDYFPLVEGEAEDKVSVTASNVEADILETAGGRMEVGALTARGAVTYEDKDLEFAGSRLVFDVNDGSINVSGDKSRPCLFNGAVVPGIQYNLKTGKVNTRIIGPGAIR